MNHPLVRRALFASLCTLLPMWASVGAAQTDTPYTKRALSPQAGQLLLLAGPAHPANPGVLLHGAALQRSNYVGDTATRWTWSGAIGLEAGLYKTLSAGVALRTSYGSIQDPLLYLNVRRDFGAVQCLGRVGAEIRFATDAEKNRPTQDLEYYSRDYNYRSAVHCKRTVGESSRLDVGLSLETDLLMQNWEPEGFKTSLELNAMFSTQVTQQWFAGVGADMNVLSTQSPFKTGLFVHTGYTFEHLFDALPALDLTAQLSAPFLVLPGFVDEGRGELQQNRTGLLLLHVGFNAHFDFTSPPRHDS